MKAIGKSSLGYWVGEDPEEHYEYELAWVGSIPIDARARALDPALDLAGGHIFPRALARAIVRSLDIELDLNYLLDIDVDVFTLRERIAGNSPAFEGIRFVKERVK